MKMLYLMRLRLFKMVGLPRTPKRLDIDGKEEVFCQMKQSKVKARECITCDNIFGKTLENKILCKNGSELL